MTATLVEVARMDPPVVMGVQVPAAVEERLRRQARQAQVPMGVLVASWLAAGSHDALVPEGSSAAVRAEVPAALHRSVHDEATRRGLQPEQVAAARLASVGRR